MTANQTIDGVPELLARLESLDVDGYQGWAFEAADKLRALLDAPAKLDLVECDACPTSGGCVSVCMKAPAASTQPQGEPVAWKTGSITWAYEPDARRHGEQHGVTVIPLYAEQPAPVAVVLPERYDESQYRGTSLLAVRRWNACLDEVTRLNTK